VVPGRLLQLRPDTAAFYRVWPGHIPLATALGNGSRRLDGPPAAVRGFAHRFAWNPMAGAVRGATERR